MKLFLATVNWYSDFYDKEEKNVCYIFANTYSEACKYLDVHFEYINNIFIEEISDDVGVPVLFLPEDFNEVCAINNANQY